MVIDMCLASLALPSAGNDLRTVWPSGLRRWLQAPVRKGVGSNPTAVTIAQDLGHGARENFRWGALCLLRGRPAGFLGLRSNARPQHLSRL